MHRQNLEKLIDSARILAEGDTAIAAVLIAKALEHEKPQDVAVILQSIDESDGNSHS